MSEDKKNIPSLSDLTSKAPEEEKNDTSSVKVDDAGRVDGLSPNVVATVPNKTPAELAAETPQESAARYGITDEVPQEVLEDPQVPVYKDTPFLQVPSGTHLHPDIAKDLRNRGISQRTSDNAQVKRQIVETQHFAGDAPNSDKF